MSLVQKFRDSALNYVDLDSQATDQEIFVALLAIIEQPEQIDNTNRFASLLVDIGDERFIKPLIDKIAYGVPSETSWLADYMYALIQLLNDSDEYHQADDSFAHQLGDWLLNTQGGEISWKAGDILSEVECPASKEYLLKGAVDESLLHMTRISCVRGIINHFRNDARILLRSLENDSSPEVREACSSAMAYIDSIEEREQKDSGGNGG